MATTESEKKSLIVGDLMLVKLDVHIWSGRRKLDKTDLIHANPEFAKLPEADLANMGSVKIYDPKQLQDFHKFKGRAETILRRAGLPYSGAIGVPCALYPLVYDELMEVKYKFNHRATEVFQNFEASYQSWRLQHLLNHPEWQTLFGDMPSPQQVAGKLSFAVHANRVGPPSDDPDSPMNDQFKTEVGGLKGQLLRDVSVEATEFVESLMNRPKADGIVKQREFVTPKTLGPLRRAAAKLQSFAFLDPTVGPLAQTLQDLLSGMPDIRHIDGQKLIMLSSIGRTMMDQKGLAKLSSLAFAGWSVAEFDQNIEADSEEPAAIEVTSQAPGDDSNSLPASTPSEVTNVVPTEDPKATDVAALEPEEENVCNMI